MVKKKNWGGVARHKLCLLQELNYVDELCQANNTRLLPEKGFQTDNSLRIDLRLFQESYILIQTFGQLYLS